MKTRILAIAPYHGIAELMQSVVQQYPDIILTVKIGDLESSLEIIESMDLTQFDIIVSRGGTAQLLSEKVSLPIIEVDTSVYDILQAIRLCENFQQKFAIVGYYNITKCAYTLCDLLQYDIEIYTVDSYETTYSCIQTLKERGINHIVCDMVSQRIALEFNINAILILSKPEDVEIAFQNAIKIHTYLQNSLLPLKNEVYKKIAFEQETYISIYSQQKILIYSSFAQNKYLPFLEKLLQEPVHALLSNRLLLWEHHWKNYNIVLKKREISFHSQTFNVLILSMKPLPAKNKFDILVYNNLGENVGDQYFDIVTCLGESAPLIEKYSRTNYPILICGETGCLKEKVAKIIYSKGTQSQKPMYIIDFSVTSNQNINKFITNINSPFHEVKRTFHLKHLESLSDTKLMQFIIYIKESGLANRNRLLLSIELSSENYVLSTCYKTITNSLNCYTLHLKPLRYRKSEMSTLCNLFISRLNMELGKQVIGLNPDALTFLQKYSWPYNLKQLQKILRELIFLTDSSYISAHDTSMILQRESPHITNLTDTAPKFNLDLSKTLHEITHDIVHIVLTEENMNKSRTAQRLGISRSTLWRLLEKDVQNSSN